MPKMIYICILLIYFKVISKKGGHYCPRLPYLKSHRDVSVGELTVSPVASVATRDCGRHWPSMSAAVDVGRGPGPSSIVHDMLLPSL